MPGLFEVGDLVTADLLNQATYRPYAKCHQTVAQTGIANNVLTALSWTTEDHDPEGWHDNVTNNTRFTPNIPGEYEVIVEPVLAGTATATSYFTQINLNGAALSRSGNAKPGASAVSAFLPTWVDTVTLNGTTDYVEGLLSVATSGTESTNVSGTGQSRMIVRFLGANS